MQAQPGTILILGGTDEQRQAARSGYPHAMPLELPATATAHQIVEAVSVKRAPHLETRIVAFAEPAIGRDAVHNAVVAGDTFAAVRWTTMSVHGARWCRHAIGHCERIARGEIHFVDEVQGELMRAVEESEGRGLVIGSGPSLGTQADHVYRASTLAVTAVCDTAVTRVRDLGVVPDIVCCIESNDAAVKAMPPAMLGEIFIYGPQMNPDEARRLEDIGYRCYMAPYGVGGLGRIFQRRGVEIWTTGGSVGTACYTTLAKFGATEVWAVGLDCGMAPDGRTYPEGVHIEPQGEQITFTVPGRDTPEVATTQALDHYRIWLASACRENKWIVHHNASVGGALIEGWRQTCLSRIGGSQ